MSVTIRYEAWLFLMSVGTGVGLSIVYDCLRIFRLFCPHNAWALGTEDLIYGIYSAVMTFALLYEQNDGNLRGYCIGGVILGMAVYENLVSRRVLKCLQKRVEWLKMKIRRHQNRSKQVRR
ncbi:MAG: spore cortex biosynthesis protein YabQ [Hungatella sp.]|jgi:spore cortex biosynthesis protein YabQ|nr:spore cortex biosynthesis protein YabQ [Hungatella sp.]